LLPAGAGGAAIRGTRRAALVWCLFLALFVRPAGAAAQDLQGSETSLADLDMVYAQREFRLGVQAYNRYGYNEAIQFFEKALAYKPGQALFLDWLGKANFRSGLEDIAVSQWQAAAEVYGASSGPALLLGSRVETVRNRRGLLPAPLGGTEPAVGDRFVESGRYPGKNGEISLYRQPTAVLPLEDGSAWVAAYGSNELVRIDANGLIRDRRRGPPLTGFDRPYGLARGPEGNLYVSEYRGGRVSVLNGSGEWQYYIGSKGLGPGQFVAPQNIAVDEEGYLFVVDYGSRLISKFDPSGAFILSFGGKSPFFQGFLSPTGVAAKDGRVYAADSVSRQIVMFDRNGAYLGALVSEGLLGPESLRFLENGALLASDLNRVLLIDTDTAIVTELGVLGNANRVRLTDAGFDRNGNVLAADFKTGEVAVMTRMEDMASGLFVQIERVVSDSFPLVTVELQVQDRRRRPIVGLEARNFLLTERGAAAAGQNFLGAAWLSNQAAVSVLIERSAATRALRDELAAALRDINAAGNRLVSIVSAGEQPLREDWNPAQPLPRRLEAAARGSAAAYSPRWRFDQALRLAATDLLPGEKKRAVVFVTSGSLGELAFERYALPELAAYLSNNDIAFYAVIAGGGAPGQAVSYLCAQTGGRALSLYRSEGVTAALKALAARPSGSYTLSYHSRLPADFGRAYLPLDAEVYLLARTGRDTTGYFPPLE